MSDNRGKIRNRQAVHIIDFSAVRLGKITPTDVDGMIEYQDKAFIFIEAKHGDAPMPFGQGLALERLSDTIESTKKPSVIFLTSWTDLNENGEIDGAKSIVKKYYTNKRWWPVNSNITLSEYITRFLNKHKLLSTV